MNKVDYDFQILRLTDAFYNDYPNPPYIEILKKVTRAYNCIIFEVSTEYFVCIPYRTEIQHSYAYHFKKSTRSIKHRSGLDYTKMVILKKLEYLDSKQALIDSDEYRETVQNIDKIKICAIAFLDDYINHIKGDAILHSSEFRRRYQYSPLKYFHVELGL